VDGARLIEPFSFGRPTIAPLLSALSRRSIGSQWLGHLMDIRPWNVVIDEQLDCLDVSLGEPSGMSLVQFTIKTRLIATQ
jgi:hypothetical protein